MPLRSKRQSSTFSACAENSAKLTPPPSQVAPSGDGRPGQTRLRVAVIARTALRGLGREHHRAQRGQRQIQRVRLVAPGEALRHETTAIAHIAAAIKLRIRIEDLPPPAPRRRADPVAD